MLSHLQKSVMVKDIQLAFIDNEMDEKVDQAIHLKPTLSLDRWIPSDGKCTSGQINSLQARLPPTWSSGILMPIMKVMSSGRPEQL
jgi:hypothetical protein